MMIVVGSHVSATARFYAQDDHVFTLLRARGDLQRNSVDLITNAVSQICDRTPSRANLVVTTELIEAV